MDIADRNNSVLRVGLVDGTDDQSSYQCIFATVNSNVFSRVGTLKVLGELDSSID